LAEAQVEDTESQDNFLRGRSIVKREECWEGSDEVYFRSRAHVSLGAILFDVMQVR
jgi:hypothetical protein